MKKIFDLFNQQFSEDMIKSAKWSNGWIGAAYIHPQDVAPAPKDQIDAVTEIKSGFQFSPIFRVVSADPATELKEGDYVLAAPSAASTLGTQWAILNKHDIICVLDREHVLIDVED